MRSDQASILHFYINLFPGRGFVVATWTAMAFWLGGFFANVFFCTPIATIWYSDMPGKCGDSNSLYIGCAPNDLIIDVITILILPPAQKTIFRTSMFSSSNHGSDKLPDGRACKRRSSTHEPIAMYEPDVPLVPLTQSKEPNRTSNESIQVTSEWKVSDPMKG